MAKKSAGRCATSASKTRSAAKSMPQMTKTMTKKTAKPATKKKY